VTVGISEALDFGARAIALTGVGIAGAIAATHWAVRKRAIPPFGAVSKTVRSLGDPMLRPIEKQLARRGGNPQDATFWLLGIAIIGGLVLISVTRWLGGVVASIIRLGDAPPSVWVLVAVDWAFGLLMLALIVRVIGSWIGQGRFNRWMVWVYKLTDWLVNPIQRVLPTFGSIDLSPLVAYVALIIARAFIGAALR
jgi:YggT family protein